MMFPPVPLLVSPFFSSASKIKLEKMLTPWRMLAQARESQSIDPVLQPRCDRPQTTELATQTLKSDM